MGPRPSFQVSSWDVAVTLLRYVVPEAIVTISKVDEPILPDDLSLRRSDVPWSIHKGARHVYRENQLGRHVQIREFDDRWTLELDNYNPHYQPVRHIALDTPRYTFDALTHPIQTTSGILLFGPVRGIQLAGQLATDAVSIFRRSLFVCYGN